MDLISLIMLILGLIGIVFGFLYGKKRGLTKATVRLILVGLSALMAFLMRETITEVVLTTPVSEGKSIVDLLTEGMASGEDAQMMEGLMNVIKNILTMILQIVAFIMTFFVLRIATLILYWIIAAIIKSASKSKVRKQIRNDIENFGEKRKLNKKQTNLVQLVKNDQETLLNAEDLDKKEARKTRNHLAKCEKKLMKKTVKRDRKPWWGGLVGLLQGVLVVICVMGPLNGLILNATSMVKSLSNIELNGEKLLDEKATQTLDEIGILTYPDSSVAKVYDLAGGWLYRSISTVKNEDGTASNIQSQLDAVDGGLKMVDAVSKLTELEFEDGFDENAKDQIVDIFTSLDEIKKNMSEESVKELDKLIHEALGPMLGEVAEELPIDLSKISFANVDFATEGEVVSSFFDLYESIENGEEISEDEMMEEIVTTLSESTLILPVLSQVMEDLPEDERPNLDEEEAAKIEEILDGLENKDNVEDIRKLFGLN